MMSGTASSGRISRGGRERQGAVAGPCPPPTLLAPAIALTQIRPFRNDDAPALTALWNRAAPASASASTVARLLSVHEFDAHVIGNPCFDPAGLLVAECQGQIAGFAHAGFGPESPGTRPLRLARELGVVAMLVVDPGPDAANVEDRLLAAAEDYLRARGAVVLYAGGQYPLNPFYWGIYGGSEWAGILGAHQAFHQAARRAGYVEVAQTVILDLDLTGPERRDPRNSLVRRQVRLVQTEDVVPGSWWDDLAIGEFRPTLHRLLDRSDETELARALSWDMAWFGRSDSRSRLGLYGVEVHPDHRRQGLARFLIAEVLKLAREEYTSVACVQTGATNTPALGLYQALGFQPIETATVYRRPGPTA